VIHRSLYFFSRDPIISAEETKAHKYVERGETDLALVAYQRIQPVTARVLNAIGQLCADKKGDYAYALQCHTQALKMQEEVNFVIYGVLLKFQLKFLNRSYRKLLYFVG
jgi:hypothetical protein